MEGGRMAGFSELVKNFAVTRDYIRDFFIYGFKTRNDFGARSGRTYDDEKRRAECWLSDFIRSEDSRRGRQISISVDSDHIAENPLYQVYRAKSFTDNDIRLHFFLIDVLADGEWLTLAKICSAMSLRYGADFGNQTVRNKLREYAGEGIVIQENRGNAAVYSLSPDTLDSFMETLPGLADAVCFFSEAPEFGVVGNTILRSAGLRNDVFMIKHNYIVHALEDEVLSGILEAAGEKRSAELTVIDRRRRDIAGVEYRIRAVPMQAAVSTQTGRRFLLAYIPELDRFRSMRLDFILSADPGEVYPGWDSIKERFDREMERCFGVSFQNDGSSAEPLKLTFEVKEDEDYVLSRLEREKRSGTLERTGEELYTLTIDVSDPNEVMHWAKTFIGRTVSIEGGSDEVREHWFNDIRRMYMMYGGDGDDSVQ